MPHCVCYELCGAADTDLNADLLVVSVANRSLLHWPEAAAPACWTLRWRLKLLGVGDACL